MKKKFTLIMTLIVVSLLIPNSLFAEVEEKKTAIELEKNNFDYQEVERSNKVIIMNVFFNAERNKIECELYNIGTAQIYLVDTTGSVVNETFVETDVPTSIELSSALCKGDFHIIIISDHIYAEGFVKQ